MAGYAGVLVRLDERVLMVRERYERWEAEHWNLPSGAIEPGETPSVAAARELAEESGAVIASERLELIWTTAVIRSGAELNRSWNYVASTSDARLAPVDPDDSVLEAGWIDADEAAERLALLPYPPIREPAVAYLRTGDVGLHWSFDLPSDDWSSFRWDPPTHW